MSLNKFDRSSWSFKLHKNNSEAAVVSSQAPSNNAHIDVYQKKIMQVKVRNQNQRHRIVQKLKYRNKKV